MHLNGPFSPRHCNNEGYALATVIMISLIISVIIMAIVSSVRKKTVLAQELTDRNAAYLKTYSAMNEVVYKILTSTFTGMNMEIRQQDGKIINKWNLYGKPINLAKGITVKLHDVAGRIPILFDSRYLRVLMMNKLHDSAKVNIFADTFADWQDKDNLKRLNGAEAFDYRMADYAYGPRNFYIQTLEELKLLKGFDQDIWSAIQDDIVYWGSGRTNYLTMSKNLLTVLLQDDSLVDKIIQLRTAGNLTARIFRSLTGLQPNESVSFWPSGWIKIELTAKVGKSVDRINAVIVKRQMLQQPFIITEWKK